MRHFPRQACLWCLGACCWRVVESHTLYWRAACYLSAILVRFMNRDVILRLVTGSRHPRGQTCGLSTVWRWRWRTFKSLFDDYQHGFLAGAHGLPCIAETSLLPVDWFLRRHVLRLSTPCQALRWLRIWLSHLAEGWVLVAGSLREPHAHSRWRRCGAGRLEVTHHDGVYGSLLDGRAVVPAPAKRYATAFRVYGAAGHYLTLRSGTASARSSDACHGKSANLFSSALHLRRPVARRAVSTGVYHIFCSR